MRKFALLSCFPPNPGAPPTLVRKKSFSTREGGRRKWIFVFALLFVFTANPQPGLHAADPMQRIEELEKHMLDMQKELHFLREEQKRQTEVEKAKQEEHSKRTNILAEEFEKLKTNLAVPEKTEYKSLYGMGPAASKIYNSQRGLSIGGYGEGFYRKFVGDKTQSNTDTADYLRGVLYFGYKFNDWILFNSEIEYEHASTSATKTSSSGEVSVEFAYLDFFFSEYANARVGLLLVPMGFLNEMHEPNTYHGVNRTEVETAIIPTTWRENGVGLFGRLGPDFQYRLYAMNGLNARGISASGLRGGRQKGNRTIAEDISVVGRVDYTPHPSVLLGGSFYTGDQGNNQKVSGTVIPDSNLTLWEAHGQYRSHGLELRGLFTMAHLGDARELTLALRKTKDIGTSETIGSRMLGTYGEIAYDFLPLLQPNTEQYLAPFVRFEYFDTHEKTPAGFSRDKSKAVRLWVTGVSYKPHPNVVLKLDYRDFSPIRGKRADEVNFGVGFAF